MILSQAFNSAALKNPSGPAVVDLGKTTSYADVKKRIGQLSYLYQAEIGYGSRVAFLSQNNLAVILSFFAFSNTGILSFFLSPSDSKDSMIRSLRDLEITHIAVSGDLVSRANELVRSASLPITVVEIEKKKGGEYDPSFSPPPEHPLKEADKVLALRVSEFGEEPKYIFYTHKQLYIAATAIRKFYHPTTTDKYFTTLNWAHPFGFVHTVLLPLFFGATCAINPQIPKTEFDEYAAYIAKNRINRFVDVPKYYFQLLAICKSAKYTLPDVKSVTVGMGLMPKGLRKTFDLLKIPVVHCYGRAENVWTVAMEDTEKPCTPDATNYQPLPGYKYKVLDEAGDEIEGEGKRAGPLAVMGEAVMTAFFHPDDKLAAKATKQTIRGTWFYTGEVARLEGMEADGMTITPLGRIEDTIRSGKDYLTVDGMDEVAKELTEVSDAAGFVRFVEGEPRLACAVVRLSKGLNEQDVLEHLKARLQGQAPASVHFMDEIPKDEFDHVNRGALQRLFSVA